MTHATKAKPLMHLQQARLDAFTMPVSLAWGLDPGMGYDPDDSFFLLVTFVISFTFWALDIVVPASVVRHALPELNGPSCVGDAF